MLFDKHLTYSRTSFKIALNLSNPAPALSTKFMSYSKSFVFISTIFTVSSPGVDSISRNQFLCSSIGSNSSSVKILS